MGHLSAEDVPLDRNALVVARREFAPTAAVHRACYDHRKFAGANLLRVIYTDSPVSLFQWSEEYGTRPHFGAIVVAADPEGVANDSPPRDDVAALKSNRNLDSLGGVVTAAVETMDKNDDRPIHVCFTWVDTLIDVAGEENTFQFLRLLLAMIDETDDCGGHFHFDPSDLDKDQLLTVEQLFDTTIDMENRFDRARSTTGASSRHENL